MPPSIHPVDLVRVLKSKQLTPAIIFLTSRRSCDNALSTFAHHPPTLPAHRQRAIAKRIDEWVLAYPSIQNHPLRPLVIKYGVAAHHAGHLPSWKIVIEELMREGALDAVFATTTLAAGVDFPARTVIITQSSVRKNQGFVELTTGEVQQLAGRAGRRSKDLIGFAIVTPSPYIDLSVLADGLTGQPESLESRFEISYSMVLNLLKAYPPDQIQTILDKSFAQFQLNRNAEAVQARIDVLETDLASYGLRACSDWISQWHAFQQTIAQTFQRLRPNNAVLPETAAFLPYLTPGRVIAAPKRRAVVLRVYQTRGRNVHMVTVMRQDGQISEYQVSAMRQLLDATIEITTTTRYPWTTRDTAKQISQTLKSLPAQTPAIVPDTNPYLVESLTSEMFQALSEDFPCPTCPSRKACGQDFRDAKAQRDELSTHIETVQQLQTGLWRTFQKRMDVLQHLGYLTASYRLTDIGEWARLIRISPSLLVTELIRTHALDGISPAPLAGVLASIAHDDDRPAFFPKASEDLTVRLAQVRRLSRSLEPYEAPPLLRFDVAALPERWVEHSTMTWAELSRTTSMAEGDIYRLLARNLEYLSQIRSLSQTHPTLADTAEQALRIMRREVLEELP